MSKRRLSEQFREQLGSLGESLAKHTRSLESHFEGQEQLLIERQHALAEEQQLGYRLGPYWQGMYGLIQTPLPR